MNSKNYVNTNVSQVILRQIPTYKELIKLKHFPCNVNFDFVSIATDNLDYEFIDNNFEQKRHFDNALYNECFTYISKTSRRYCFTLLKNKKEHNKSNFNHQIQIIPTHFSSQEEWIILLIKIMGEVTNHNHKVSRLDISFVNDYLSPGLVFYCTHFKWKQSVSRFNQLDYKKGSISGLQSKGSRSAVSCYTGTTSKCKSTHKKKARKNGHNLEFQMKSKSLTASYGINTLFDIKNFTLKDKLFFVEFYDMTKTYESKKINIDRFKELQRMVISNGLNPTRYILNKNKNFSRDYGKKLMVPLRINNDKARVSYCLKKRFHSFINEWNDIFNQCISENNNVNFIIESAAKSIGDSPCFDFTQ